MILLERKKKIGINMKVKPNPWYNHENLYYESPNRFLNKFYLIQVGKSSNQIKSFLESIAKFISLLAHLSPFFYTQDT